MPDTLGSDAVQAIDKLLVDRPEKVGHDFSEATRRLTAWREQLINRWRQTQAEGDKRNLERVNAAISVVKLAEANSRWGVFRGRISSRCEMTSPCLPLLTTIRHSARPGVEHRWLPASRLPRMTTSAHRDCASTFCRPAAGLLGRLNPGEIACLQPGGTSSVKPAR